MEAKSVEWFSGPGRRGGAKEMTGWLPFPATVQAWGSQDVSSLSWECEEGRRPSGSWRGNYSNG